MSNKGQPHAQSRLTVHFGKRDLKVLGKEAVINNSTIVRTDYLINQTEASHNDPQQAVNWGSIDQHL